MLALIRRLVFPVGVARLRMRNRLGTVALVSLGILTDARDAFWGKRSRGFVSSAREEEKHWTSEGTDVQIRLASIERPSGNSDSVQHLREQEIESRSSRECANRNPD
jgi:hypothetical protein